MARIFRILNGTNVIFQADGTGGLIDGKVTGYAAGTYTVETAGGAMRADQEFIWER